jgi:hypothetical protein
MKTADFGRGIKAGAAAAGAYLVLAVILAAIGQSFWYRPDLISAAGLGFQLEFVDSFALASSIWSYVFRGIVFGAILAAVYSFLPGATGVRKGVVFSAFLWILGGVAVIYITPGWPGGGTSTVGSLLPISLSSVGRTLVSIASALAFGALTGFLWGIFRGKELANERSGRSALLVSFVLGGVGWASETAGLLVVVVVGGNSILDLLEQSGSFWWYGILFLSAVFLGLPGWILAFVAWRRTRRDESGFKLGVAGGVVMALTGIMLLEGVLAIIGAVLSRRKRAIEPGAVAIEQ